MAAMTGEEMETWLDVLADPDFDIRLQHMSCEIERQWKERHLWPTD